MAVAHGSLWSTLSVHIWQLVFTFWICNDLKNEVVSFSTSSLLLLSLFCLEIERESKMNRSMELDQYWQYGLEFVRKLSVLAKHFYHMKEVAFKFRDEV